MVMKYGNPMLKNAVKIMIERNRNFSCLANCRTRQGPAKQRLGPHDAADFGKVGDGIGPDVVGSYLKMDTTYLSLYWLFSLRALS